MLRQCSEYCTPEVAAGFATTDALLFSNSYKTSVVLLQCNPIPQGASPHRKSGLRRTQENLRVQVNPRLSSLREQRRTTGPPLYGDRPPDVIWFNRGRIVVCSIHFTLVKFQSKNPTVIRIYLLHHSDPVNEFTFLSFEKTFSWLEAMAESEMSRITRSLSSIVSYLISIHTKKETGESIRLPLPLASSLSASRRQGNSSSLDTYICTLPKQNGLASKEIKRTSTPEKRKIKNRQTTVNKEERSALRSLQIALQHAPSARDAVQSVQRTVDSTNLSPCSNQYQYRVDE